MTDMKRSTISFPDDVMDAITEMRKLPEYKGKPLSKIVIYLIREGLEKKSGQANPAT